MKSLYVLLVVNVLSFTALSQTYDISAGGTINACSGVLVDDGGSTGAYGDGTFTITICPENPGDVVQLEFVEFNLQTSGNPNNSDRVFIYDGPNTASPTLGDYAGTALEGLNASGTIFNASGCLTIRFASVGAPNTTFPGFLANISCTSPCDNPVSSLSFVEPEPVAMNVVNICPGDDVTFSAAGSASQPGFSLERWIWNWGDGTTTIATDGNPISHVYNEPGGYNVTLVVEDDNECQSLNLEPVQVFTSTVPVFSGIGDIVTESCVGTPVDMFAGALQNITWTSLPPQLFATPTYLSDDAGFTFTNAITYDFFEPGSTLANCEDLLGVNITIEHSYMGDLIITLTCPNGQQAELTNNVGANCFLGQATDGDEFTPIENIPGVGYDYTWSQTATNGTWGDNSTGNELTYVGTDGETYTNSVLPAGTYEPQGDLCDLVGCPLNGAWTLALTDDAGADNGNLFSWSIDFNPLLFPDVTSFTPTIGAGSDSSFWSGPGITGLSGDGDEFVLDPDGPGAFTYTYNVINSFGCAFDTTITVTFTEPMAFSAGPDMVYVCGELPMQASFDGMPAATCSQDAGTFTYCYGPNELITWNICPDTPGDGTAMTLSFQQGWAEVGWDEFTIYNGPDAGSPILASNISGELAGQSWTATNASGCLTAVFTSDGIIDCTGGNEEWIYTFGCTSGGPEFVWEWSPAASLSNPNVMNPSINGLNQTTTFTLSGYPVGFPGCVRTDEVEVTIDPIANPGVDTDYAICASDAPFPMLSVLDGNPVNGGTWTSPSGAVIADGQYDPSTDPQGEYTYTISYDVCELSAVLSISYPIPATFQLAQDDSVCYGTVVGYEPINLQNGLTPFLYLWSFNGESLPVSDSVSFEGTESGELCLTIVDDCQVETTDCHDLYVEQPIPVRILSDTTAACWPDVFQVYSTYDTDVITTSNWSFGDGTTYLNTDSITKGFEQPGVYDVQLQLISDLGCTYDTSISSYLSSWSPPLADWLASPTPALADDALVSFDNLSEGDSLTYVWGISHPDGNIVSQLAEPVVQFPMGIGGEYNVILRVTDSNGCQDTWQNVVIVNDLFQTFIPTSFTPNNDGVNDVFRFTGTDIDPARFKFTIFNRWGEVVFQTTDPEEGWLGNHSAGTHYVSDEVYVWMALVSSKSTGEREILTGTVTLFR
jgi:gliding motility-associated-like protein